MQGVLEIELIGIWWKSKLRYRLNKANFGMMLQTSIKNEIDIND